MSGYIDPNDPKEPSLTWTSVHATHISAEELSLRQSVDQLMARVTRLEADLVLLRMRAQDQN